MDALIRWLAAHRTFTLIASGAYFVAVVVLHEEVSKISVWLQTNLSLRTYDAMISTFGVVVALVLSPLAVGKIRRGGQWARIACYWAFTAAVVAAAYNTLMVVNVESIHFPQYAVLALPLYALTGSYGVTILSVALLGALDEGYQFFVLKNWKYLDFNDIILNLLGGGIGLVLIFTLAGRSTGLARPLVRLTRSTAFVVTAALIGAGVLLWLLGLVAVYPGPQADQAWIVLSRVPRSDTFWIRLSWGRLYHVLTPLEGILLWTLLAAGYASMDGRRRADPSRQCPWGAGPPASAR